MVNFLLFEAASGFSLFEVKDVDNVGLSTETVQSSITDMARFSKIVTLLAFKPFATAVDALEQINAVSESAVTEMLAAFIKMNLPKAKEGKKAKFSLGVVEPKLASAVQEATGVPCACNEVVGELARGVRLHFTHYVKQLETHTWHDAQRGLAHSYSRARVKFNVNRMDNMIIQAIALLDTLDKDVNTFIMRVREWYGWHFPELGKIVSDHFHYARVVILAKDKVNITEELQPQIQDIVDDPDVAEQVVRAAKTSMGQDISEIDLANIEIFAKRVISLAEYRRKLHTYLHERMHAVAPNLSALIGEVIGARLISHAGSLTNLAKAPASTVQILGAEKALFRALKTKGNTPKYGLIFHSTFIGRAKQRNKGRISRYLANKCSLATRLDAFMDNTTPIFGEKMRDQVEERLKFYDEGIAPRKNATVMAEATQLFADALGGDSDDEMDAEDVLAGVPEGTLPAVAAEGGDAAAEAKADKKKKKKEGKKRAAEEAGASPAVEAPAETPPKKKKKRTSDAPSESTAATDDSDAKASQKKKKKDKKSKESA